MTKNEPLAKTPYGVLRGRREGDLNIFRGVRFAEPPVGARRFLKPVELPLSSATFDAAVNGPIAPQLPARVEFAMGPVNVPQGEDCLTATVWAPADLGSEKVPVLVWFHGGAFTTGAGSIPWYSGAPLARKGRIVVVAINSRLGALGYMRLPGVSPGNLGLHDQFAGLRWVKACVAGFGGDPEQITIMGQSAGAYAGLAMVLHKDGRSLFRRDPAKRALCQEAGGCGECGRKGQGPRGRTRRPADAGSDADGERRGHLRRQCEGRAPVHERAVASAVAAVRSVQ